MAAKTPINRFIEYFSKPLSYEQLIYLNTINNVTAERVTLYKDFIISLCHLIYDTYMGDDVTDEEERKNHFNWCWNRNIHNFSKEGVMIEEQGEHYYYFYNYFSDTFYSNTDKGKKLTNKIMEFWNSMITYDKIKTKSEYDIFIEVFKTLNKYFFRK